MTESEWWAATKSDPLVDWLFYERLAATLKFKLFWIAVCRECVSLVPDYPELIELLDLIEQTLGAVADSQRLELQAAVYDRVAQRGVYNEDDPVWNTHLAVALVDEQNADWLDPRWRARSWEVGLSWRDPGPTPRQVTHYGSRATAHRSVTRYTHLLHDIFGPLPFRDIAAHPSWLTTDVLALARGIYDERAFDRMPILADALQDAGCDNDDILSHCRAEGWEHVRGCWVIDLLLGRPWRESQ